MSVLEISRVGACAVLTMNQPAARLALDMDLRNALAKALPRSATIRRCARGDADPPAGIAPAEYPLRDYAAGQGNADVFEGRNRILSMQRWFDGLVDLEKPVIAAVDGVAFGAWACRWRWPPIRPGLATRDLLRRVRASGGYVPDLGGMYLLPRAVGLARAKALAFRPGGGRARGAGDGISRTSWSTTGRCSMPALNWPGASSRRRRARWASSSR